jgi:hypothetical protein
MNLSTASPITFANCARAASKSLLRSLKKISSTQSSICLLRSDNIAKSLRFHMVPSLLIGKISLPTRVEWKADGQRSVGFHKNRFEFSVRTLAIAGVQYNFMSVVLHCGIVDGDHYVFVVQRCVTFVRPQWMRLFRARRSPGSGAPCRFRCGCRRASPIASG